MNDRKIKFYAPTKEEALLAAQAELGSNIEIISGQVVFSGGFFGFFRRKEYELIVKLKKKKAQSKLDIYPLKKNKAAINSKPLPKLPDKKNVDKLIELINSNLSEKKNKSNGKKEILKESEKKNDIPKADEENSLKSLEETVKNLEKMVKTISNEKIIKKSKKKSANTKKWDGELGILQRKLEWHGVKRDIIISICTKIEQRLNERGNAIFPSVKEFFIEELQSLISINNFDLHRTKQHVISLLGPTGIGKTTTIAKLSSEFLNKKDDIQIGFITIDTYRIGATEQLQGYGELMSIPTHVVFSKDEMKKKIREFELKNYELIFIDTAGRSPYDCSGLNSLCEFISTNDIEKYIVLSSNSKESDMENNILKFSATKPSGCIITKLDETRKFGFLLNLSKNFIKYPIYCMTKGQDAHGEIDFPNHQTIANMFYKTDD